MTDDISIDVPTAEDWDQLFSVLSTAFHEDVTPEISDVERLVYEPDRSLIARRDGEVVGTAGIYTRQLSVPGAVVPAAHVTLVSVAATARRQGLLTRLMGRQFADARAAGESIAVLWASEGRIYQRFGYGLASSKVAVNADGRELTLTVPPGRGRLREGSPLDLRDSLAKVYDEAWTQRPGWSERRAENWEYRLRDPKEWRGGGTELRAVIHELDGAIDGYALWRVNRAWNDGGPNSELRVSELVATTPDAYRALWTFLLKLDLTRSVSLWAAAPDEPLLYLASDPRRLGLKLSDALWLRVLDVPAALAARRYATDINLVIEVDDAHIPSNAGRWRLTGSRQTASCEPTTDEPDLVCDVRALGAAYLGGASFTTLADAGLARETHPGGLARAGTAFGWDRHPSSIEVF